MRCVYRQDKTLLGIEQEDMRSQWTEELRDLSGLSDKI
jgi:hypothetical protein